MRALSLRPKADNVILMRDLTWACKSLTINSRVQVESCGPMEVGVCGWEQYVRCGRSPQCDTIKRVPQKNHANKSCRCIGDKVLLEGRLRFMVHSLRGGLL